MKNPFNPPEHHQLEVHKSEGAFFGISVHGHRCDHAFQPDDETYHVSDPALMEDSLQ